jgi:hypothetical protein
VLPGTYTVRLTTPAEVLTTRIHVEDDPRIRLTDSQRKAHQAAALRLNRLFAGYTDARTRAQAVRSQLSDLRDSAAFKAAPQEAKVPVEALWKKVVALQEKLVPRGGPGAPPGRGEPPAEEGAQPPPPSQPATPASRPVVQTLLLLTQTLDSITEPPSSAIRQEIDEAAKEVDALTREVDGLTKRDLPGLNRRLEAHKLTPLKLPARAATR